MPKLTQNDIDEIENNLEKIFKSTINISSYESPQVPHKDEISENDNYSFECAILFVDIRSSTQLSDESMPSSMAKIYRAFTQAIIRSINKCGGSVRQIVGDRVMGVFISDRDETAAKKSLYASRAIVSIIEHVFNPLCHRYVNNKKIGCGIGIDYGKVLLAKVGISSRKEDATELVWAGRRANIASKHTDLAKVGEIFVTKRYYDKLPKDMIEDDEGHPLWEQVIRVKSNSIFEGYSATNQKLDIISDRINDNESYLNNQCDNYELNFDGINQSELISSILEETKEQTKAMLRKFENITIKEEKVSAREKRVTEREKELTNREVELEEAYRRKSEILKYNIKLEFLQEHLHSYSEEDAIDEISELCRLGKAIGKNELQVKKEIHIWEIVNFFSGSNDVYAFNLITQLLRNQHSDFDFPLEQNVLSIAKTLGKERELHHDIEFYLSNFTPSEKHKEALLSVKSKLSKH